MFFDIAMSQKGPNWKLIINKNKQGSVFEAQIDIE